MRDRIDHESPIPLYHQLAEALRYRIATGELPAGRRLPSLRSAAARWGVNMHTVRRAYAALAEDGIVAVRARVGTVVLGGANGTGGAPIADRRPGPRLRGGSANGPSVDLPTHPDAPPDLSSYLRTAVREARARWGASGDELVAAFRDAVAESDHGSEPIHVIECSEIQCRDLARQIEDRWRVRAEPWSLEWDDEPPPGPLVATYFHYNDVRVRWPLRFASVYFAATRPEPGLLERIERFIAPERPGDAVEVVLCERDETMVRNIAADLSRILPAPRFAIRGVVAHPHEVVDAQDGPILMPPRVWAELSDSERRRPGMIELRYVFEPRSLEAIGGHLGWESR